MIFKDICRAFNANNYVDFKKRTTGDVLAYIAVILLICSIGSIIVPTARIATKIFSGFMSELPGFTVTQDGMTIDSTFDFDYAGIKIYATNEKSVREEDFGDAYTGMLLDKDKIILKTTVQTAQFSYNEFDFSGKGFSFTKNDLSNLKRYMYIFIGITDIMMYAVFYVSYIVSAMFVGAIANVICMIMRIRLPIMLLIKLGVYAKTAAAFLFAVLAMLGYSLDTYVSVLLSTAIMYVALRKFRADNDDALMNTDF